MGIKKGLLFSVDALIASIILIGGIIISSGLYIEESKTQHMSFLAEDALGVMSEIKINEINNSYVDYLILQGDISNFNNTIIEQIGELWALNKTEKCRELIENITSELFPSNLGLGVAVGNEDIYIREFGSNRRLVVARKMISGYEKSKPIKGSTSRAYLKSISEKKTSAFAYFGGFEGQGNISKKLEFIPTDATIESAFIELDVGSRFDFYVDDTFCNSFVPIEGNMSSTRWNISNCTSFLSVGVENNLSIIFTGLFNESFVAGGYVKVNYRTSEMINNKTPGVEYYYFPGIEGLINLYSSFNVPGPLNSVDLYIHFYNNKTTFLNIGNDTVFNSSGSSNDQIVNIEGVTLPMGPETIPIRMGVGNISETINVTSGEPANSVLVTDVSGSMDWCGLTGDDEFCTYDCYWWWFYQEQKECTYSGSCSDDQCGGCSGGWYSTSNHQVQNISGCIKSRIELAKEADLQFVDTVLNISGNRIGLVSYQSDVESTEPITDIKINLESEINSYIANGGTCICCGVNSAKDMLVGNPNNQFMVVMSDGAATMYCDDFNDYTGSGTGGSSDAIDKQWAINSGQNACGLGITVFTVGFGEDADHDTLKQVACNESLYYNATNASQITEIYQEIGEQINVITNYSSQIISVVGEYKKSILYPDSYIRFNFTPVVMPASFGEIEVVIETDKFSGCDNNVDIPAKIRVTDANVLSYSGKHWTSSLSVNSNFIFNISEYGSQYRNIGDPFVLQVDPSLLQQGNNQIYLQTADNPENKTGCSRNNSMIYTAAFGATTSYSEALPDAVGCKWTIENEDMEFLNVSVPATYSGSNNCSYTNANVSFSTEDSIDQAVYFLISNLDFDDNGRINVNIDEQDLEIEALWVSQVPYLWGPSIVEVKVWQ